uniref:Uncharacterized protein n=1 Tax=Arundo donax TaxID=35708 RepID=A0A0A9EH09_ARUDO
MNLQPVVFYSVLRKKYSFFTAFALSLSLSVRKCVRILTLKVAILRNQQHLECVRFKAATLSVKQRNTPADRKG